MPFRDHGAPGLTWWGSSSPTTPQFHSGGIYVGVSLFFDQPGRLRGARFFRDASDTGSRSLFLFDANPPNHVFIGDIYSNDGAQPSGNIWINQWFHPWFRYTVGHNYILMAQVQSGLYWNTPNGLPSPPTTNNNIEFWNDVKATLLNASDSTISTDLPGIDPIVQFD